MISIKKSYLLIPAVIIGLGICIIIYNVKQREPSQQSTEKASLQQQTISQQPSLSSTKNTPLNKASLGRRMAFLFINLAMAASFSGLFGIIAGVEIQDSLGFIKPFSLLMTPIVFITALWFEPCSYLLRVAIVDSSGKPVGNLKCVGRTILEILSFYITWIGLLTKDGRFLHDRLLNVYVVHKPKD